MFAVSTTRLLLGALVAVAAVLGTASAEDLIAIDVTSNDLYRLQTDDMGSPVVVGHVSAGTDLSGLVVAGPDRLYTFDRDGNSVITVSASDASVLSVVTLDRDCLVRPRGFDVSPGGVLYGVFGGMELRTVDPSTGQTTLVAGISGAGAGTLEALAFAPDGTLYSVGAAPGQFRSDRLFTLDPETAVLSLIGSLNVSDIDCLTYGLDGFLYGADSLAGYQADLYRIDPVTAHLDIVGNTAVYEVNGIVAIASVPEPATLSLLALGAVALVRRRKGGKSRRKPMKRLVSVATALLILTMGGLAEASPHDHYRWCPDPLNDAVGSPTYQIFGMGFRYFGDQFQVRILTNFPKGGVVASDSYTRRTRQSPGDFYLCVEGTVYGVAVTTHANVVQQAYPGTWPNVKKGRLYRQAVFADGTYESYEQDLLDRGIIPVPSDGDLYDGQNTYPTLIMDFEEEIRCVSSVDYYRVHCKPWKYQIDFSVDMDAVGLTGVDDCFNVWWSMECGNDAARCGSCAGDVVPEPTTLGLLALGGLALLRRKENER